MYNFKNIKFYLGGLIALFASALLIVSYYLFALFQPSAVLPNELPENDKQVRERADNGDVEAMLMLVIYYYPSSVMSEEEAWFWIKRSADLGYPASQNEVGVAQQKGDLGQAIDKISACEWFIKAAKGEDVDGQYNAAFCYRDGIYVSRDDEVATAYFTKSAMRGYGPSQYSVYLRYRNGIGVSRNRLFANVARVSARRKHFGTSDYVRQELSGLGAGAIKRDVLHVLKTYTLYGEKNWAVAARKLALAGGQGDIARLFSVVGSSNGQLWSGQAAQFDASQVLLNILDSKDVDRSDPTLVEKLLLVSAHLGDIESQRILAHRYDVGKGVTKNAREADYWRARAELH